MKFKSNQTYHFLSKHFCIDKDECLRLIKAIDKRRRFERMLPSIIGLIVAVTWIVLFGRGTDELEGTSWDFLKLLGDLGPLGLIFGIFSGLGIALILSQISAIVIRRKLLHRQFRYNLLAPACFWCGYSLKGHDCDGNYIQCPECGEHSRIGN